MRSSAITALSCLLGCAEAIQLGERVDSNLTATAVQYVRFTGASTYTFLCGIWFRDSGGSLLDNQCEREDLSCTMRCTVGAGGYGNTASCPGATPQWQYTSNKNFRFTGTGQGGGDGIALFASEWIRPNGCWDSKAQGGVEGPGPVTVTIDFGTPLSFTEYYVAFQSDHWSNPTTPARAPSTWILEASNDGVTYNTVHTQASKPTTWSQGSAVDAGWLSVDLSGVASAPTAPPTPSPTPAPIGFAYDEYIGGCCSGQNQLGTPLSNPTIADCKTYCDSESTCVSFEVYPQSHTTPNFNCWFSTTCAINEVPALNCGHDLYIKGAPTTGGTTGAAAVGDPHLQNIHGERFDLMKEGRHVLINIPRGQGAEQAMLRVQADARRLGGQCADMYFQELNVTGSWAEAKQAGGYHYSVSQSDLETPGWAAFGKVELKVVQGRTDSGLRYLNVYVKHLARAGFAVGGLLGEDDHEDVITPPETCAQKLSLADGAAGGLETPSAFSVAEASLA